MVLVYKAHVQPIAGIHTACIDTCFQLRSDYVSWYSLGNDFWVSTYCEPFARKQPACKSLDDLFFFELSIKYPSLVQFEETFQGCYNLHGDRGGKLGILGEVSQVNEFVNLLVVLSCVHVDGMFTLISYSLPWDDLFPDHVQWGFWKNDELFG